MKTVNALIALAIAGTSAMASAEVRESGGRRAPMAVELSFSSRGSGIDSRLQEQVLARLDALKFTGKLELVLEKGWGREGEVTLCAQFKDFSEAYAFGKEVRALLPSSLGLTQVSSKLACYPVQVLPHE